MHDREPQLVRVKSNLHLKIPTGQCGSKWTKGLPPGTMFFVGDSNVRPTGGQDSYYFDLGCTLTVVAKEESGLIRGVSYSNVVRADGGNAWVIHHELEPKHASAIFTVAQKQEQKLRDELEQLKMPTLKSLARSKAGTRTSPDKKSTKPSVHSRRTAIQA